MHQYAYIREDKTIHSSGQLENYKMDVNEESLKVPGILHRIKSLDSYVHPLNIKNGSAYIPLLPYIDKEWEMLPHIIWTSDKGWSLTVLDSLITDSDY